MLGFMCTSTRASARTSTRTSDAILVVKTGQKHVLHDTQSKLTQTKTPSLCHTLQGYQHIPKHTVTPADAN